MYGGHLGRHLKKQCCANACTTATFSFINYRLCPFFWYIENFFYRHTLVCPRIRLDTYPFAALFVVAMLYTAYDYDHQCFYVWLWIFVWLLNGVHFILLSHTVPTKSLETAYHFPITFHYNTMLYQIKKTHMHFQTL